jgi:hypothetical protein
MCDGCDVCLCLDCAGLTQDTMPRESEVEFYFVRFFFLGKQTLCRAGERGRNPEKWLRRDFTAQMN